MIEILIPKAIGTPVLTFIPILSGGDCSRQERELTGKAMPVALLRWMAAPGLSGCDDLFLLERIIRESETFLNTLNSIER